ncbi:MAG: hypothetical protein GWP91_03580 [Rhodobacterales bacterium]|nr:hypothetical protein [Rhodobacterales bacterium]
MWLALFLSGAASAQTAPNAEVIRALSLRHPIACAELEALTPTPVSTLLLVVDDTPHPSWAPMRAADCLIAGHATEIRDRLADWVVADEYQGFGRMVLANLDAMPLEVAVPVAQLALEKGPLPDVARARILAAKAPELRALVPEVAQ